MSEDKKKAERPSVRMFGHLMAPKETIYAPNTEDESIGGFFGSWMAGPEYRNRLGATGYADPLATSVNRLHALSNIRMTHDPNVPSMASAPPTRGSRADININPSDPAAMGTDMRTLTAHETSHVIGAKSGNRNVGFSDQEASLIRSKIIKGRPEIRGAQGSPERAASQKEYDNWRHLNSPDEIKADIDATRYNMFKKGIFDIRKGEKFGKEQLEKAKKEFGNDNSFKRLLEQVGDDNYIELMNTLASAPKSFSDYFQGSNLG